MVTATAIKPYREVTPAGKYILNLHPGQTKAWESTARFIAISSGTQSGKTCFTPDWMRREINTCGPGDYLVVTATFPLLDLKLLPEFLYVFATCFRLGEYRDNKKTFQFHHVPGGTNGSVKVIDSTRIIFASATNPESIESATAKAAVCDEAGQKQFKRDAWEAIRRRLSLNQGRCLFSTTLYNSGWFINEIYQPAERREAGFELIQFDSIMNPAFPEKEYREAEAMMPKWKFWMFYRGRFLRPAGLVYDSFDPTVDKIDRFPIPKTWLVYSGHDFGSANPAAIFYAVDPATAIVYAWQEYLPGQGRSTYEHVEEFKKITAGYTVIDRIGGNQNSEEGWRNDFTSQGWPIRAPSPDMKEPRVQFQRVYGMHKQHRLKVFSDLYKYLDQKTSFSYKLNEKYEPTEDYEDEASQHLLRAESYVLSSFRPETVQAGGSAVVVVHGGLRRK
jgi:hypothetical protein